MKKGLTLFLSVLLILFCSGCVQDNIDNIEESAETVLDVPEFYGMAYIPINDNVPTFTDAEITTTAFENYSELDYLSRCGVATACIGREIMPTEERGAIGMVKPTGWHTVKYDIVDGKYLYNRCHLIGYQLTGENANEQNLITGTRFLNIEGMLPFEDMVADYIKETGNHVMYRVTPIFEKHNLLCNGVQMEGYSVEDNGEGICFNIFAYNAQPQVEINYLNGESALIEQGGLNSITSTISSDNDLTSSEIATNEYVINKNSKKIHLSQCYHAKRMKENNKIVFNGDLNEYTSQGYTKCQTCLKDN